MDIQRRLFSPGQAAATLWLSVGVSACFFFVFGVNHLANQQVSQRLPAEEDATIVERAVVILLTLSYANPLLSFVATQHAAAVPLIFPYVAISRWSSLPSVGTVLSVAMFLWRLPSGSRVCLFAPISEVVGRAKVWLPDAWQDLFWDNSFQLQHLFETLVILCIRPANMLLLGVAPSWWIVGLMSCGCVVTALVLNQWSEWSRKGAHSAIDAAVQSAGSVTEQMPWREHIKLALLALNDAVGQEMVHRGLFLHGLLGVGIPDGWCNVIQALGFGAGHWHGVPSGWTGMGLTFVYGWFMGWLVLQEMMGVALVVHWLADYFIYTIIARKKYTPTD